MACLSAPYENRGAYPLYSRLLFKHLKRSSSTQRSKSWGKTHKYGVNLRTSEIAIFFSLTSTFPNPVYPKFHLIQTPIPQPLLPQQ